MNIGPEKWRKKAFRMKTHTGRLLRKSVFLITDGNHIYNRRNGKMEEKKNPLKMGKQRIWRGGNQYVFWCIQMYMGVSRMKQDRRFLKKIYENYRQIEP